LVFALRDDLVNILLSLGLAQEVVKSQVRRKEFPGNEMEIWRELTPGYFASRFFWPFIVMM
jgi:hypothetical protein